ncbi:inner membrane protein YqjK [Yersinia intermedia]|nr:inner membrane protein YqjK [Yersinia intermedia]
MSRRKLAQEKAALLREIQQQRLDLAHSAAHWIEVTAPYDRGWAQIVGMRKYLMVGSSLVALYGIRHPSKLIRWSRRAVSIWGTIRLFRSTFFLRYPAVTSLCGTSVSSSELLAALPHSDA